LKSAEPVRKPSTKWVQRLDGCPHRSRAGSHFAPLRSPGPIGLWNKLKTKLHPIGEWIDEWAAGGSVTGEPSIPLRGNLGLTLAHRERKRRDSNRGLVITAVRLFWAVWTHVCQHDPPSLTPRLPTQQATPHKSPKNHEKLERKQFCPLDSFTAISTDVTLAVSVARWARPEGRRANHVG
jgi:hypothetical protein